MAKISKIYVGRFRIPPQMGLNFSGEITIDNFAGGGGASTGIEAGLGRPVDIAINHDPASISMHEVNHPHTSHFCESVWDIDPVEVCAGRPVGLAWFSPDCKHFSKAKGGKPVEKKIRGLAWVVLKWAAKVRPRVIMLENVEEFITWGPLTTDPAGNCYPCPKNKGRTFNSFINALKRHGYAVEYKELRACDYGAPTIRKRLFLVARCDDQPITWPEPTHGDPESAGVKSGQLKPWRTAAECIDWSLPCPSIFERKKPLAEATLRRIAKGIMRYVVNNPEPFIVPLTPIISTYYGAKSANDDRCSRPDQPIATQTTENRHAVVSAFLAKHYGGVTGQEINKPSGTVTTIDHHSLVTAHMVRHFGESVGSAAAEPVGTITAGGLGKTGLVTANLVRNFGKSNGAAAASPMATITSKSKDSLIISHLVKLRGTCRDGQPVTAPMPTVTASGTHVGEVRAFLLKYYGSDQDPRLQEPLHTITTRDRFGLVTVRGEEYQIVDIGLRMLSPRELFRAQGFQDNYIIDRDAAGKPINKTNQVARCGNSVCPPIAEALVRANMVEAVSKEWRHSEEPFTEDFFNFGECAQ
jgi:DNA (cytosine-5)-methyltransferase 1